MINSAQLEQQTGLLIATIDAMQPTQVGEPSLLPNWSRGHVLAHIDGNARGLARLVRWALDGIRRDMYISPAVREGDIQLHAGRSLGQHQLAITQSARQFADEYALLSTEQLENEIELRNGRVVKARSLLKLRLQEVAIHHLDLNLAATFGPEQWPAAMVEQLLPEVVRDFQVRAELPIGWIDIAGGTRYEIDPGLKIGVSGSATGVLAWLLGRSSGSDLGLTGAAALPPVPSWR
ncbi:MAG: maleylpyruvate isomerase family mycothiol-dependent enzyme [Candidatus Nanopelagicales bacterium]|nr:maleylpyruvate isomerase family mycothiol-dependent enzyme [Candidatus Nanopelagicales bacterium]